jgi:hypothetical protein
MSALGILPLLTLTYGVGSDEDFNIPLAFYLSDGVTPISLIGITFTASLVNEAGTLASFPSSTASITTSGSASNILTLLVAAQNKQLWPDDNYELLLTGNDGINTRDILQGSTVVVGTPIPLNVSPVVGDAPLALNILLAASPQISAMQVAIAALQAEVAALQAGGGGSTPSSSSALLNEVTIGTPLGL